MTILLRAFQLAEEAKSFGDYVTANEIFVALLKLHLAGDTLLELEVEPGDSEDPYYDLFVIRFPDGGEQCYLCIPRPLLVGRIAARFIDRATVVERRKHGRVVYERYDCNHALKELQLDIPHGWLLPPNSSRSEWLTAAELEAEYREMQHVGGTNSDVYNNHAGDSGFIAGSSDDDWYALGHDLARRQRRTDALGAILN